jgi:hypothetical protein
VEIELEFIMRSLPDQVAIFYKGQVAPMDATKGYLKLNQWAKTFDMQWTATVGSSTVSYTGLSSAVPIADGVRTRMRWTFNPNNGTNRVITLAYSTWNGTTWSAYTTHTTWTQATTQWVIPPGPIYVNLQEVGTLYGCTIRRTTNGIVEGDLAIDQYDGFGVKSPLLLGTPTITIWNYSWSGLELRAFTGVYPLTGGGYANYDTDFTPRNTCAVIANTGHNANTISSGKEESTDMLILAGKIAARFPRASFFVTAQNPGIDARANGTPGQYLDYTFIEPMKISRQAHLMDTAVKNGWGFLNIRRAFLETANPDSLVTDGLHPNAAGSLIWADEVFRLIQG